MKFSRKSTWDFALKGNFSGDFLPGDFLSRALCPDTAFRMVLMQFFIVDFNVIPVISFKVFFASSSGSGNQVFFMTLSSGFKNFR